MSSCIWAVTGADGLLPPWITPPDPAPPGTAPPRSKLLSRLRRRNSARRRSRRRRCRRSQRRALYLLSTVTWSSVGISSGIDLRLFGAGRRWGTSSGTRGIGSAAAEESTVGSDPAWLVRGVGLVPLSLPRRGLGTAIEASSRGCGPAHRRRYWRDSRHHVAHHIRARRRNHGLGATERSTARLGERPTGSNAPVVAAGPSSPNRRTGRVDPLDEHATRGPSRTG
jgi:hypothetical protein